MSDQPKCPVCGGSFIVEAGCMYCAFHNAPKQPEPTNSNSSIPEITFQEDALVEFNRAAEALEGDTSKPEPASAEQNAYAKLQELSGGDLASFMRGWNAAIAERDAEIARLEKFLAARTLTINGLDKLLDNAIARAESAEQRVKELEQELASRVECEKTCLEMELDKLKQELAAAKDAIAGLNKDNIYLHDALNAARADSSAKTKYIDRLEDEIKKHLSHAVALGILYGAGCGGVKDAARTEAT
jgi:chromosome segregation ATPase